MNILRLSVLSLITMMFMPVDANAHCGGKHTGNHPHCANEPPPPPPIESCADASGVFPSFAYTTGNFDGKHGSFSGTNLHLANSDGSCSIIILTKNDRSSLQPSYRQFGDTGRIVWEQAGEDNLGKRHPDGGKSVVKMLDFTITNGELVGTPSLSTVYMYPNSIPNGILGVVLSPDGNTIFHTLEISDGVGGWPNSLHAIDVSSCTTGCQSQIVIPPGPISMHRLAMNASGQRLYISGSNSPGVRFIEVTESGYSSPRIVASKSDLGGLKAYTISVGKWDFDGNGSENEVVAIGLDNVFTVSILDVSNCNISALPSPPTCLAFGDSSILRSGFEGYNVSFQGEDLLIGGNVGGIELLDTDSETKTALLQGEWPDAAE